MTPIGSATNDTPPFPRKASVKRIVNGNSANGVEKMHPLRLHIMGGEVWLLDPLMQDCFVCRIQEIVL